MIYIGSDHEGFLVKEEIRQYLIAHGYQVTDLGTNSEEPVDYPIVAEKVARKVVEDPNNRGILICLSGIGVCIVANKIKGVRAGQAWSPEVAVHGRNNDNINILCLSAGYTDSSFILPTVQKFLNTSFGGAERFNRRIKIISEIDSKK